MACQYCNEEQRAVFPSFANASHSHVAMYIDKDMETLDIANNSGAAICSFPINYCPMCGDSWCQEGLNEETTA